MSLRLPLAVPSTFPGTVLGVSQGTWPNTSLNLISDSMPEGRIPAHPADFSPNPIGGVNFSGQSSSQFFSGTEISTLFPVVKSSTVEPSWPVPQEQWIVQRTLHTTWHLYPAPGFHHHRSASWDLARLERLPTVQASDLRPTPTYSQNTGRQSNGEQANRGQSTHAFGTYLRNLLVFSCGAAVSTLIYTDPISSLKGLFLGSSLASLPTLTPQGAAFIETAERQLYHLDRLAAQQHPDTGSSLERLGVPLLPENTEATLGTIAGLPSPPSPASLGLEVPIIPSPDQTALPISSSTLPSPPEPIGSAPVSQEDFTLPAPPALTPENLTVSGTVPNSMPIPEPLSSLAYRTQLPLPSANPGQESGELLGVLEQGEESMALFQVNGTIERVAVGERLTNGATFTGTQDGKALLQVGESQVPLAVGQSF
jgi:hypothetical protein